VEDDIPEWQKMKPKEEEIKDPKNKLLMGKGKQQDKIPEKDLNLTKKQGDLLPEETKPMKLKPFEKAKPLTADETKSIPDNKEKKIGEIDKQTPKSEKSEPKKSLPDKTPEKDQNLTKRQGDLLPEETNK
jgi:hypothetical protein